MRVHISNTAAKQTVPIDEPKYFLIAGHRGKRNVSRSCHQFDALTLAAHCQLANDIWVHEHALLVEEVSQNLVPRPDMIDPNGYIEEDHAGSGRPRGWQIAPP